MSLNELYGILRDLLVERHPALRIPAPVYQDFRAGDVRHSQADVTRRGACWAMPPTHDVRSGLVETLPWYEGHQAGANVAGSREEHNVRDAA